MGRYKMLIAIFTALDTIWWLNQAMLAAVGHPKLDLIRSPTTIARYDMVVESGDAGGCRPSQT
eukprot:scaffold28422_cov72-Skeletonema_marinoi.AAC.1